MRVFKPLRRYRREISDDLAPRFEATAEDGAGLAVLGITSAHGRTRKGGRISSAMRAAIASFFPPRAGAFKVLVLHHHLARLGALGRHDVSRKASATLTLAQTVGVDLVLCGHLHISHVEAVETAGQGSRRVVIASAGTATSTRGRGQHRLTNFYNRIHVFADRFDVVEYRFDGETGAFAPVQTRTFSRV